MDLGLTGLRVAVTGGTRGIGAAIVKAFLAEGAAVALCARGSADVDMTVKELSAGGAHVVGQAVDVAVTAEVDSWIEDSAGQLGGIDVVVANASAMSIADSPASWERSCAVDLVGTAGVVNVALPHLRHSDAPAIVTLGSVSGREIDMPAGAYGSVKAAVIHYTKALARQLAPEGIRANCVSPGNTYFDGGVWSLIEQRDPEHFAAALAANPFGRMASPDEIAAPVVFLGSPAASFVSGTNFVVDGALTHGVQF